jgi:hypothetical protein
MHPVRSSAIEAIGYDPDERELHVRFVDTGLYVYFDVDRATFDRLCAAASTGAHFNQAVKARGFAFEKRG